MRAVLKLLLILDWKYLHSIESCAITFYVLVQPVLKPHVFFIALGLNDFVLDISSSYL